MILKSLKIVFIFAFLTVATASLATDTIKPKPATPVEVSDTSTAKDNNGISKDDIVTLYGEIDEEKAYEVITRIHAIQNVRKDKPILMLIESPGGSVAAGTEIIDAMEASVRPINTIAIGEAASMASYIHSFGVKRMMFPRAVLMYHMASGGYGGEINKGEQEFLYAKKVIDDLDMNIVKRSGKIDIDTFRNKKANEWYVTLDDALRYNLVDSVTNLAHFPVPGKPKDKDKTTPWPTPIKLPFP